MNPFVTIGIPTYNRAGFLKDSLGSALSQTYSNIEVVVVDNASTDDTKDVVESFDDCRIKYFRNEKNIGGSANFERCLNLSTGEYFSWLQDDDVLFNDFVETALEVSQLTNCDFYFASCVNGESITDFRWAPVYAPPIDLDWVTGKPLVLDPNLGVPLSFFATLGMPPVAFYRKVAVKPLVPIFAVPNLVLFSERLFFANLVCTGKAVIHPKIAGVFRSHGNQLHKMVWKDNSETALQLMEAAKRLSDLAVSHGLDLEDFKKYISTRPLSACVEFLKPYSNAIDCPPFLQHALEIVRSRTLELQSIHDDTKTENNNWMIALKNVMRELCPPIIYSSARKIKDRFE
jgi:hypothetical protein